MTSCIFKEKTLHQLVLEQSDSVIIYPKCVTSLQGHTKTVEISSPNVFYANIFEFSSPQMRMESFQVFAENQQQKPSFVETVFFTIQIFVHPPDVSCLYFQGDPQTRCQLY